MEQHNIHGVDKDNISRTPPKEDSTTHNTDANNTDKSTSIVKVIDSKKKLITVSSNLLELQDTNKLSKASKTLKNEYKDIANIAKDIYSKAKKLEKSNKGPMGKIFAIGFILLIIAGVVASITGNVDLQSIVDTLSNIIPKQ